MCDTLGYSGVVFAVYAISTIGNRLCCCMLHLATARQMQPEKGRLILSSYKLKVYAKLIKGKLALGVMAG